MRYLSLESLGYLAASEFSHEAVKKHQEVVLKALQVRKRRGEERGGEEVVLKALWVREERGGEEVVLKALWVREERGGGGTEGPVGERGEERGGEEVVLKALWVREERGGGGRRWY